MLTKPHPPADPYDTRRLDVGAGHSIYVEQYGNPQGAPAIVLHGGPGSGCQPGQRQWFDPNLFRVVLFDQRGAGRSTPADSLAENTTWDLVADMEVIRANLEISRWMVVGGSWGVTLGLAYAQRYPDAVSGMVLRAVFLGTPEEVRWAFVDGPQTTRPDLWNAFISSMPESGRRDPLAYLTQQLHGSDARGRDRAAQMWGAYERALSQLEPNPAIPPELTEAPATGDAVPSTPRFESYYFQHDCWLEPDQLLHGASGMKHIPGIIVQGRYDLLCPPRAAYALAEAWGNCDLRIVEGAGHSVSEPGIRETVVDAVSELGLSLEHDQTI